MRCLLPASLLCLVIATSSVAQDAAPDVEVTDHSDPPIWQTTSGSAERVAMEAAQFMLALEETGWLPLDTVTDSAGRTIEQIMRDEGRFVGAHFPVEIDRLMCRYNAHVCRLPAAGPGDWRNAAGASIHVPALKFHEFTGFGPVDKPVGVDLTHYFGMWPASVCIEFAETCDLAISNLNTNNPDAFDIDNAGSVILPTTGYKVTLEAIQQHMVAADDPATFFAPLPEAVTKQIIAVGGGAVQGAYPSEPAFEFQEGLFNLIAFPFAELDDVDDIPEQFREPVRIAIADSWLDEGHCDLAGRISVATTLPANRHPAPAAAAVDACGHRADATNEVDDHATHVVGLIAAGVDGQGIGGLNPFAEIIFRQIDLGNLRHATYRNAIVDGLVSERTRHRADILNLSWRYFNDAGGGGNDTIGAALTDTLSGVLVVAAAGNDGTAFQHGPCLVLPACYGNEPNVLAVVGFDRNLERPGLWETDGGAGSNSGADFHVGAIAADVVSSVSGNRYGEMSGTSQAAPQVTATAAYIISAYRHLFGNEPLPPVRVKNRIIYTSDIFPNLLNSAIGGRLNMRRALGIDADHLQVRLDGGVTAFDGQLVQLGNNPSDQFIICRNADTGQDVYVYRDDLYRLVYLPMLRRHVVFARKVRGDRDSAVYRMSCDLRTGGHAAEFHAHTGEVLRFRTDQIMDFVSAMY